MSDKNLKNALIAKRIAQELKNGDYVNLGIGIPTEVVNHLPQGVHVTVQSENGVLGAGPAPLKGSEIINLTNAGGMPISLIPGGSYFDSFTSFSVIRGGRLAMTVLGALEVDQEGSIANWMIPGKKTPGMGGAMDLLIGAKKVVAAMQHTDKEGNSKILKKCTLPLTAYKKLSLIVTDLAFMEVTSEGLLLREMAEGTTVEEVKAKTEAHLILPSNIGRFSL